MENQKTKKRGLILILSILLIMIIGGVSLSVAYFTASTESKTNVFTVGSIAATLTEPAYDALSDQDKVIIPNKTIAKDPTVTVTGGSEAAYVRVFVKIDTVLYNLLDAAKGLPTANAGWTLQTTASDGDYTILQYHYDSVVAKSASDTELDPVFSQFAIIASADQGDFAGVADYNIYVVAQLVQAEGFANSLLAFAPISAPVL